MKVLLCYPYRDDAYRKIGFLLPPLGLGYLASTLRVNGHDVEIRDLNLNSMDPDYGKYDLIGISCDTTRYKAGVRIAQKAKRAGAIVVMGGPHVTFRDSEALNTGVCDYVLRGEGEETFPKLVNALQSKKNISDLNGISFLSDQVHIRTPDAEPPDVRTVPRPARDLLKINAYQKVKMGGRNITSIVTSRGCPHKCSFCSSTKFSGLKWRALEPIDIVDEIEEVVRVYGFNGIAFLDDNFTLNSERVIEICSQIVNRDLDIYWWCLSRADTVLRNEEMVQAMAKAGAKYVFMGFESRSAATLKHYNKKIAPDMAKEAVKLLKGYGISTHASFILGDLNETEDMIRDTIEYAKEISPEAVQFSVLTPYPGTSLFEEAKERIFTRDWDLFDCLHPTMMLEHLTPEQLVRLLRKAYVSFYFSPRRIYNGLFSVLRGKGIKLSSIARILRGIN